MSPPLKLVLAFRLYSLPQWLTAPRSLLVGMLSRVVSLLTALVPQALTRPANMFRGPLMVLGTHPATIRLGMGSPVQSTQLSLQIR